MSTYNKVILSGRVGNDPELKSSAGGVPYLRLSLATHSYKKGGEGEKAHKTTHWHRVMVFGNQAETCAANLRKGSSILVDGSLEIRTYTDKEDRKVTNVSVIANRIQFLGGMLQANVVEEPAQLELAPESAEMVH